MPDTPTITLNDGREMPQLGLGVAAIPAGETARLVSAAIDAGYRAIDTATVYGNEAGVGDGVCARDETIFVTTKLWRPDFGYDAALRGFERSMAELRLDWLDLYLLHWPFPAADLQVESWKALVRLRDEGRVRSIGVSNFRIVDLERIIDATGVVPATNQVELHPRFQQRELRAFHEANGIATTCWSPLGHGTLLDDPAIGRVAARVGRSPAQVVIRWHLQQRLIAIPKTATPARLAENLALFDFELSAGDMAALDALDRVDGRTGPDPAVFEG